MSNSYLILVCALWAFLSSCTITHSAIDLTAAQEASLAVVRSDQVDYVPLNPARGDSSPKAGVLWGDIRRNEASGVLLQFADGFSSPPHIHNTTYRAVVISGEMHNDDPESAMLWMGPGSFWTQPAGENHITAARPGSGATAFLEILTGPYLVQPARDAFDSGERPINLHSSNLVWMGVDEFDWIGAAQRTMGGPQVALLWGSLDVGLPSGSFLKLPSTYAGKLYTIGESLKSVVIQGDLTHSVATVTDSGVIKPGGYFASAGGVPHSLTCQSEQDCILYVRTNGIFEVL